MNWFSRIRVQSYLLRVSGHYYPFELGKTENHKKIQIEHTVYADYAEYLVEQALIRAGYTVVAKDTYYFNGISYRRGKAPGRPMDLDFIAKVPSSEVYAGVQVKNRMEAPKSDAINELIDICRYLHLKPLLVTRAIHPFAINPIINLKGYVVVFKRYFLQPEFPRDKFNEIINIGIPIGVYRYPPDFLIMRLTEAARRLV